MKATRGFTLMELLVVVAIIGILAGISYPYYNDYVIRGKLPEAQSALSDGRVQMEQFFQDNRTYAGGPVPANTPNFNYSFSGTPDTATYTILATGQNTATGFVFSINQNNVKATVSTPSGWGGAQATCWIRRKGSC